MRASDLVWNVLTVLVWLAMASVVMAFVSIYNNPQSGLNPFRPVLPVEPTVAAALTLPTETATSPATPTVRGPKPTRTQTPTVTPTATITFTPTVTHTPLPSATPTVDSLFPFRIKNQPTFLSSQNFPMHEECKLWVAGQVVDLQKSPVVGIQVWLGGSIDGHGFGNIPSTLTGTAPQFGQAGYEFLLADHPVSSKQSLWVQLYDQSDIPLSARVRFDTSADCSQNIVLINFEQVR